MAEASHPSLSTQAATPKAALVFAGGVYEAGTRNYISERDLTDDAATIVLGPTALAEWYLSGCRITPHRSVLASVEPAPIRANGGKHDALANAMAHSLHAYVRDLRRVLDARRIKVLAMSRPRGPHISPQVMTTAALTVRRFDRWGLQAVRKIENARTHANPLMRLMGNARPNPD